MTWWENKKSLVRRYTSGGFPVLLTCESSEGLLFLNNSAFYTWFSRSFTWKKYKNLWMKDYCAELLMGNHGMSSRIQRAWENVMLAMLHSSSEEVRAGSQLDPAIPLGCNPLRSNCIYANGDCKKGEFGAEVLTERWFWERAAKCIYS